MSRLRSTLVTGGSGFIGGYLTRRLLSERVDVHVIVQPGAQTIPAGAVAHVHDGTTRSMAAILESVRPDAVFHLASVFLAAHRPDDIESLLTSNVVFGTQLLDAMVHVECGNLVNTGTAWQNAEGPKYSPVNLYSATKQAFEDIARFYALRGVSTTTLALYDTYGPNDPRPKVLPLLLRAAGSGELLELSPGDQLLHLVYIDDIVDAFMIAAGEFDSVSGSMCRRYSIASDVPVTLRELVSAVEHATGRNLNISWGARPYRDREVMRPWVGQTLPGWQPRVPIEAGIRRILDDELRSSSSKS